MVGSTVAFPLVHHGPLCCAIAFSEDRLGVTASSLTFTTLLALVRSLPWRWRCLRPFPSLARCS